MDHDTVSQYLDNLSGSWPPVRGAVLRIVVLGWRRSQLALHLTLHLTLHQARASLAPATLPS